MTLEDHKKAAKKFELFSKRMAAEFGLTTTDLRTLGNKKNIH